ncbi:MAG: hypothetical protein LUG93_10980 [Lachnospiraceae bacterium]|nr:hypothetical protein [Lachnospiraceae bacterium]
MAHIKKIKYKSANGEIYSEDAAINHDLNETLNLNCSAQYLKENRKAALEALKANLHSRGTLGKNAWEKLLQKYSSANNLGQKREYAGIVIWYIKRKLGDA